MTTPNPFGRIKIVELICAIWILSEEMKNENEIIQILEKRLFKTLFTPAVEAKRRAELKGLEPEERMDKLRQFFHGTVSDLVLNTQRLEPTFKNRLLQTYLGLPTSFRMTRYRVQQLWSAQYHGRDLNELVSRFEAEDAK